MAVQCKKCGSKNIVKSGNVRGKQRYFCKECSCHFVEGDLRKQPTAEIRAACVFLSALCKGYYKEISELFWRDRSQIGRWAKESGIEKIAKKERKSNIKYYSKVSGKDKYLKDTFEIFDKEKPLAVFSGTLEEGYSVVVMIQRPNE